MTKIITYSKLQRHEQRLTAMIADPDLTGDLLLIGIALARYVDGIVTVEPREDGSCSWNDLLDGWLPVRLGRITSTPWTLAQNAIRDDIRRYRGPSYHYSDTCEAPMIRRDGPCGSPAGTAYEYYIDPDTGERSIKAACNRHRDWLARDARQWRAAHPPQDAPTPAANSGGVLARHIPEIDWHDIWRRIDPRWTPPPEAEPWHKPKLRLIVNEMEVG